MELKDIDPIFVIGVIVGLAVIGGAVLYLQAKNSTTTSKKTARKKVAPTAAVGSPPRIKKDAVGSVSTPAGRRSARLARKAD